MAKTGEKWEFTYDADGLRTQRKRGTLIYNYVYSGGQLRQMTCGTNELVFGYGVDGRPYMLQYNGTDYYYLLNLQGDVIGIVNTSGTQVVSYTYDAWGNILSVTDSTTSGLGQLNPLRYRGYVYDTETQLYYLQSRYYNPEMGRFINADQLLIGSIKGLNLFIYCYNNPNSFSDSTGNIPFADGFFDETYQQIGKWIYDTFWGSNKDVGEKIEETAQAFVESVVVEAGVGLGLYGSIDLADYIEFSAGLYYDVGRLRISRNGISIREYAEQGAQLTVFIIDIGKSESLYREYGSTEMVADDENIISILGTGFYLYGGGTISAGIDAAYFRSELKRIWG